ncbi:MAG: GTP-binding protein [Ruminococcaceae bacterium]|nr:GTP-binding protein [Oscillospiraceae bacterium]
MATCNNERENHMNIVIVGHVDHGKSTVIGRLLADTHSLPEGKLEQIQEMCRRTSKPFEYAFLLDALKDERSQGITIDTARSFFKTDKRKYIIIDAPGHIEFLKNMITGASRAEAALLVIDAHEGIKENSRRHGYMLSMLGIRQVAILVNKMDLVNYDKTVYDSVVNEYSEFLRKINITPSCFIPISAMKGDNIASNSSNMPWSNHTVLEALDEFTQAGETDDLPFRMPVQDVYKFTSSGDDRRIIAGMIETGKLKNGDSVVFYPSGKKTTVKRLEAFNAPLPDEVSAGMSAGFTINEQIYAKRGELCAIAGQPAPQVSTKIKASIFWLGKESMEKHKIYHVKIGTAKVEARLETIVNVLDASNLSTNKKETIDRHEVADCIISFEKPVAFDLAQDMPTTSRFVIVDKYEIAGGGIITDVVDDEHSDSRKKILLRNYKWEQSHISMARRAEKYNQKPHLVLITGQAAVGKKDIAKALEAKLFDDGRIVYYLGIGSVLYGIGQDLKVKNGEVQKSEIGDRDEHIRRLGEVANILLDAGAILVATAGGLTQSDLELLKLAVSEDSITTVWIGDNKDTDVSIDMLISENEPKESAALQIKSKLQNKGIIFKPW